MPYSLKSKLSTLSPPKKQETNDKARSLPNLPPSTNSSKLNTQLRDYHPTATKTQISVTRKWRCMKKREGYSSQWSNNRSRWNSNTKRTTPSTLPWGNPNYWGTSMSLRGGKYRAYKKTDKNGCKSFEDSNPKNRIDNPTEKCLKQKLQSEHNQQRLLTHHNPKDPNPSKSSSHPTSKRIT
jgi:hypothetical protein